MPLKKKPGTKTFDMLDWLDCQMSFSIEKKKDYGEDCETHSLNCQSALIGVFDGCGGAGSRCCSRFFNKTEAYIASRATADAFRSWFERGDVEIAKLRADILENLHTCKELVGSESLLFGGMAKSFPTTAAAVTCRVEQGCIQADLIWSGDSRVYLLDQNGLAQLTEDDLGGIDAMDNLSDDGVLTNMINLTADFSLHTARVSVSLPCILFAATDGCFGYLSSPMEFEHLLLDSLLASNCITSDGTPKKRGWENELIQRLGIIAGDDFSLSGLVIGYGSFSGLQKSFSARAQSLFHRYIADCQKKNKEEQAALWNEYRPSYYRYLCPGEGLLHT